MNRVTAGVCLGLLSALVAAPNVCAQDAPMQPIGLRKVTLNLKDVPLRSALESLFQGTGIQYSVDPNVPNIPVSLNIRDAGILPALRIMVRQAAVAVPGLTSERDGDVYVVRIRPPGSRSVTVQFTDVPLRNAIDALFEGSGLQYSIDPGVPNVPVTLSLRDVPLEAALRLLLRQAAVAVPGLTSDLLGNVYRVSIKAPGLGGAEPPQWLSVPVRFRDAADIAQQLRQVQPQAGVERPDPVAVDNTLLFLAAPSAQPALQNLVRMLDVPSRGLSIQVGVAAPSSGGKALQLSSLTRSLTGKEVLVSDETTVEGTLGRMSVRVRPVLQGSGDILVESNWNISVPAPGGARGPIRLVKRLTTTTLLPASRQVTVGEVDLTPHGGKGVVRLWLRVDLASEAGVAAKALRAPSVPGP